MAKYFKNVKSYEDLKGQFKALLKANHPDNGGDVSKMQEINAEYDALFAIWKNRHETQTGEKVKETADSTRRQFYTSFGWEGKNHDWNRSLKEIAVIVRRYVKEKYPTYKFSVRTSYASMCQELHVELKESPIEVYKTFEDLTDKDKHWLVNRLIANHLFTLDRCYRDSELKALCEKVWEEHGNFYKCLNEVTQAVIKDVDDFVNSYNYQDCDGMIDYFHVDFYYFGCAQNNGWNIKVVPKTARIKNKTSKVSKTAKTEPEQPKIAEPETIEQNKAETAEQTATEPQNTKEKTGYTYKITKGEDTRDGSTLWLVRIVETLSKEDYININNQIKKIGGYYSKFRHAFIFRFEPSEALKGVA